MRISLIEFLTTGNLGRMWIGQAKEQIVGLLGDPSAQGGTSNRYRSPSIYKYADLELHFSRQQPITCMSLHIEAVESDQFRFLNALSVADWDLRPAESRTDVLRYLEGIKVDYSFAQTTATSIPALRLNLSGVEIYFDDEERLEQFSLSVDNLRR